MPSKFNPNLNMRITPKMRKLLNLLENGATLLLDKKLIAKQAGMSEQYLYRLLKNPDFAQLIAQYNEQGFMLAKPALRKAIIDNSMKPGKEGAKDRQLLAQAVGMVTTGGNQTVNVGIESTPTVEFDNLYDELAYLEQLSDKVQARMAYIKGALGLEQGNNNSRMISESASDTSTDPPCHTPPNEATDTDGV